MTTDTQNLSNACRSELIVDCDEASIEVAWQETKDSIQESEFFSYTLEPADNGRTKIVLWPFSIQSKSPSPSYIILKMMDLPNAETFVEQIFLPFKKKDLKKLCALCLTKPNSQDPLKVCLMVDVRAGKDKGKILQKAYDFCTYQFRKAYITADIRNFAPARIMDDISASLANKLL
jgi:hypothetical protein